MTTNRDTDTAPTTAVLQLFLHNWAHQAGTFSALPDAPVVDDRPGRGTVALKSLARRLARRPSAVQGQGLAARAHQPATRKVC